MSFVAGVGGKLDRWVVGPVSNHLASVVLLHGFGDSGEGWISGAEPLTKMFPHVKFVLPSASVRPITMYRGERIRAWYNESFFFCFASSHAPLGRFDIGPDRSVPPDEAELEASRKSGVI